MLGNEATFYDGMITCSTLSGKVVCGLVWNMDKEKNDRYLERALSGIPEHFSGRLLFRERTDTGMYLQTGNHGSRIKHPILQQHLVSGRQKILYQKRYLHGSTRCLRCDRPASGKRTTSYKRGSENAS